MKHLNEIILEKLIVGKHAISKHYENKQLLDKINKTFGLLGKDYNDTFEEMNDAILSWIENNNVVNVEYYVNKDSESYKYMPPHIKRKYKTDQDTINKIQSDIDNNGECIFKGNDKYNEYIDASPNAFAWHAGYNSDTFYVKKSETIVEKLIVAKHHKKSDKTEILNKVRLLFGLYSNNGEYEELYNEILSVILSWLEDNNVNNVRFCIHKYDSFYKLMSQDLKDQWITDHEKVNELRNEIIESGEEIYSKSEKTLFLQIYTTDNILKYCIRGMGDCYLEKES